MKKLKVILIIIGILILSIFVGGIFMINPQMQINNEIQEIEVNTNSQIQIPETKYLFKDVTSKVIIDGNVDYSKLGEYEIKYKINTLHGIYEKKQIIRIVDTQAPEITLER